MHEIVFDVMFSEKNICLQVEVFQINMPMIKALELYQ